MSVDQEDMSNKASPDFVQSLARGLSVLRVFDADNPELTMSQVARLAGLTRPTARRSLMTLVELGYVQTDGRYFKLRPRILELGYAYLSSATLPDIAKPHLEILARTVNEACSIAVLDGDDVIYIGRVTTKRIMTLAINVGTRFPAYATSMGRVLLAAQTPEQVDHYLARNELRPFTPKTITEPVKFRAMIRRVQSQGYAISDQELEQGIRSLAVPVRDETGTTVAAMNISMHASRGATGTIRDELLPHLLAAVKSVEEDMARQYGHGGRHR
jgi:IclR family pca regulon transcriptional regulator